MIGKPLCHESTATIEAQRASGRSEEDIAA